MVQSRLRPFAWLATLASVGASAALVAACSGKVSNGSVRSTSQPVSVGDISGTATACAAGSAHPNACCETGPTGSSCVVYPNAPFTQCAGGSTTYPDPRTCCPLDGQGACAAPPPQTLPIDDAGAGSGGACVYPCPVGWYSPDPNAPPGQGGSSGGTGGGSAGVTCCETAPDGTGQCMGSGSAGCTCACPACDPDGSCPPCPPCNCPAQPPTTPNCDACPPGWQAPQGEPLLCCSTAPDGTISCFSQGVPPPPPGSPSDAGVAPASCFGGGGGSPDGATFTQCGCSETVNGNDYTVTCTDPGATCICSVGSGSSSGSTTGTQITEPPTSCNDMNALFAACGFPTGG